MISSLLVFSTILIAQAPDESADDLNDTTKRLVRQLDARQLAERDAAERELIELGPAVLDLLPRPSPRMPAETVQRLARVRRTLERRRAESIALGSSITHEQAERKLSEWIETFEQQTGNKIVDFRDQFGQQADDPMIELAFDDTPFWNALDALLDHANLDVYPFAGESAVAVVARADEQSDRAARASYAGSFRLEPLEMFARRDLRNPTVHTLRLRLRASWEPKLRPIAIRQSMADLKAFGPDGEPLATVGQQAPREILLRPDAIATDLDIPLEPPARDIDRIARLEGTFQLLLPGGTETFRFTDLAAARGVEQQKGGVTVTLDRVRKNNFVWEVRLRVRFAESAGALESHRGWVFNNPVFLETPEGEQLQHDGLETTSQSEDEVGVAYLFERDNLDGHTLIYETPAVILDVPVAFEINDLELP